MTKRDLIIALQYRLKELQSRERITLTVEADSYLQDLIEQGVNRMTDDELESDLSIMKVEGAFDQLVYQAIELTPRTRGMAEVNLRTATLAEAKSSLCPLWPFC